MTYALLTVPFFVVTAAVTLFSARRPKFARRMAASAVTALALVVLTAIFDNIMIAADLFTYPPEHLTGIRIGLAPIEDFSYSVCAAFLLPAIWTLLPPPLAEEGT
ncbi:lycopene cyclase domain-containing protein [Microbacterium sp. C7(2022)]|uniref:lycopene cyclase domain-containing protein n=1 Tax=Microbacterium sp. C7(2022) TaxID=2992759 RepID=UPI00237B6AA3|nr:lycopene cyclase domain-containing protein [Microbacterium sp. C7(2022)]MDE0545680.1 lycopene cyclase domain-containing protein [Microbacterium sp. C7(2022)]